MDFTMNMIDGRGIPATQAAAVAAMGGQVTYQTHAVSVTPTVSQQVQQQQQPPPPQQQPQQQGSMHEGDGGAGLPGEGKVQELTKDDSQGAFTPPPRVSSVASHESRVEKGTDTTDFEPLIKVEIRGGIPGINTGDKDKNSIVQLHFNSVNEVLHYFSQRSVPQHIDAFNLLTNPDLVRNINPDLVRNHFLYVPNPQEGVRVASNGYSSGGSNSAQTPPAQVGPATSPVVVKQGSSSGGYNKQGDRRRDNGQNTLPPPGTIIPRPGGDTSGTSFVCWICGLDMQKSLQFEEHMVDQHSVDKPYRCDDCGVTFKRKAHLDRHRRIHLPTRPYQCAVCGKGFTRNEHVRRHSFTHSGEKPYHCPTCNKTFSRREHLTKHLLSHTKPPGPHSPPPGGHPHTPGEYEYMTSPADSPNPPQQHLGSLSTTAALTSLGGVGQIPSSLLHAAVPQLLPPNHTVVKHPQPHHRLAAHHNPGLATTLLLQATDQTGRIVTINPPSGPGGAVPTSVVTTSSASHHSGQASGGHGGGGTSGSTRGLNHNGEPVPRPYQCGVCGKSFIRNEHLRRHVLTHSGEKPHACGTCGKAFSRREHLTKHMRSHIKVAAGSGQSSSQPSHSIQVAGVSSVAAPQATQAVVQTATVSLPTPTVVSSNAHQQPPPHGLTHTVAGSHGTPVAHAAHLPPGTHYLPMFGLLAEVV
ncbi:Zinc finger protein 805 [Chionoecetes opilio]|uniref:Zinc finger protein 805 n=1 Tax=Chionoecetes opilio TaxID=41210 RepID=A0A8J4YD52_CHIOP|nr:Zinc finger protein 805 [Chionoecetes opilio]